jgi:hypothetical protein
MALTTSYLVSVKNVKPFFDSLVTAKAPSTFTQKFVEGLGFKSTNDRLFISVLKGLGFLDANSVPTERYYRFLDQSESEKVLAEAVEDAYSDLFDVHTKAYELELSEVKNKLRTLTQGKHSEKVVSLMASTFKALAEYAEWGTKTMPSSKIERVVEKPVQEQHNKTSEEIVPIIPPFEVEQEGNNTTTSKTQFHYNIQVHLPESRDESVYDAIFKSLRRHLF